jgi:hypothetical protein
MSSVPYKNTDSTFNFRTGKIYIYVIDELIAPDTVSDTVQVLVEHSMGPDAEFFLPVQRGWVPNLSIVEAQSGKDDFCEMGTQVLGGADMPQFQLETSKYTVGERLLNFRTLLKRFTPVCKAAIVPSSQSDVFSNFLPFAWTAFGTGAIPATDVVNDLYGVFNTMFMYSRGGVRLKYINNNTGSDGVVSVFYRVQQEGNLIYSPLTTSPTTMLNGTSPIEGVTYHYQHAATDTSQARNAEISVPMYTTYRNRNNADHIASSTVPYRIETGSLATLTGVSTFQEQPSTETTRTAIAGFYLRAGSDDLDFSGFVSIPPLVNYG